MEPHNCLLAFRVILLLVFSSLSFSALGQATNTSSFIQKEFRFSTGDYHLDGRLLLPDTLGRHPVILNIWGSGPTRMEHFIENSQILSKFTDSGYAVLLYDKPGSGASRGTLAAKTVFQERAGIARAALEALKKSRHVNPGRIGLYGSSQAAYVMALLLKNPGDFSFVICWSCPMETSVDQTAYQIGQYLLCAGRDRNLATKAAQSYRNSLLASDYVTYFRNASFLNQLPEVRDELGWGEITPEAAWKPLGPNSEEFLDPAQSFGQMDIPFLGLYGTLDKNIDPYQAIRFFDSQQNSQIETVWIPEADHNMKVGGSGCVQEQINRYTTVPDARPSDEFHETLFRWLRNL